MDVIAVLVALEEDGKELAAIVLDRDGDVWLADGPDHRWGVQLDDRRSHSLGLDLDRTVLGGRMPAGAASAEAVLDDGQRVDCALGGGAWIVLVDPSPRSTISFPVLFRDEFGDPFNPGSVPAEWTREPVRDSDVACPACSQCDWDVVTAAWEGAGQLRTTRWGHGSDGPGRALVCRVCGHEETVGTIMRLGGPLPAHCVEPPAVQARRRRESEEARVLSRRMTLEATTFPVYRDLGQAGRMTGSSSTGEIVTSVTVTHGSEQRDTGPELRVTSGQEDDLHPRGDEWLAREALAQALSRPQRPAGEQSDGAFVLSIRSARRTGHELAAAASVETVAIPVDNVAAPFVLVRSGMRWTAVARIAGTVVTLTANDLDPGGVRLGVASDPAAMLRLT